MLLTFKMKESLEVKALAEAVRDVAIKYIEGVWEHEESADPNKAGLTDEDRKTKLTILRAERGLSKEDCEVV